MRTKLFNCFICTSGLSGTYKDSKVVILSSANGVIIERKLSRTVLQGIPYNKAYLVSDMISDMPTYIVSILPRPENALLSMSDRKFFPMYLPNGGIKRAYIHISV